VRSDSGSAVVAWQLRGEKDMIRVHGTLLWGFHLGRLVEMQLYEGADVVVPVVSGLCRSKSNANRQEQFSHSRPSTIIRTTSVSQQKELSRDERQ
jgi:hypothetical protein